MIKPKVESKILFEKYAQPNYSNLVALLLIAKKMYETYKDATNLFKLIVEVEQKFQPRSLAWRVL